MKAGIYARKSKDTQKGESTENQIKRGIAYCDTKGWEYEVYEDFDISAKNLERKEFQRLMGDIRAGKINVLVCYRLDRVSRSVNDFSNLIKELDRLNVSFVSLSESFDTTTAMGRAMMMITSVFAQLERETIAERVRDNMVDRAKVGKWNGGVVPFGYNAEKVEMNLDTKTIFATVLSINEEEAETVKSIFDMFLAGKGIKNISEQLNASAKSRNRIFSTMAIRRILSNETYCIADRDAYKYFASKDMDLASSPDLFDGISGMMCYNKRKPVDNVAVKRPVKEWIVSVGEQQGLIKGCDFVLAQEKIACRGNCPKRGKDYSKLPNNTVAEKIYKYRKINNLTQRQLGEMIGVSDDTILNLEKERVGLSPMTEQKLQLACIL